MVVGDRCLTATLSGAGRGEIFEDESVGHNCLVVVGEGWCGL